jgi:hypothetical protein
MSDVFNELAAASRNWAGEGPTGAMLGAMRAAVSATTQDPALLREAADSFRALEPGAAAWTAVAFGTLAERGASAEVTGPAVLEMLNSWLPRLPTPGSEDAPPPDPSPSQKRLLAQFQFLCQSAVSHLARLPAQREGLGRDAALLQRLDEIGLYTPGARWVHEALTKTSGTLVLLHPPSALGLRLDYTHVSNCFHLFSLLQTAVGTRIPGGRVPDETIAWAARGRNSESVIDKAWWHYGTPASPKADLKATIWGEGLVREIPRVDGEQVVLLWPPILQLREWDAGFLGPHLEAMPADAAVERMLTPEESKVWLNKLGIARERKAWWRLS